MDGRILDKLTKRTFTKAKLLNDIKAYNFSMLIFHFNRYIIGDFVAKRDLDKRDKGVD